jgi:uncharacterized protein (TIGR03067 family)
MRRLSMALVILGFPLPALADDAAPTGDLGKLQGSWTAKVGREQSIPITLDVDRQTVTIKGTRPDGEEFSLMGELKLDEKASPKTIDWVKFTGPDGNEAPDNPGIYKLEGDTFTVCSGGPGNDRPAEFKPGDNGPPMLVTFARKKEKDKEKAAAKPDETKGDFARLQGDWKAMIGAERDRPVTFAIKGKSIAVSFTTADGQMIDLKGEVAIDEAASPRTIDFLGFKHDGDAIDDAHGLYKLEGEALTLCVGAPGAPRPGEFKAGGNDEPPYLWTFTRPK